MRRNLENAANLNSKPHNTPLFSVEEEADHYMIAVDIPQIPSVEMQILKTKDALVIDGLLDKAEGHQTVFECHPLKSGIKATYRGGMLWLFLPKTKTATPPDHLRAL